LSREAVSPSRICLRSGNRSIGLKQTAIMIRAARRQCIDFVSRVRLFRLALHSTGETSSNGRRSHN